MITSLANMRDEDHLDHVQRFQEPRDCMHASTYAITEEELRDKHTQKKRRPTSQRKYAVKNTSATHKLNMYISFFSSSDHSS